jgi:hypothetical protein
MCPGITVLLRRPSHCGRFPVDVASIPAVDRRRTRRAWRLSRKLSGHPVREVSCSLSVRSSLLSRNKRARRVNARRSPEDCGLRDQVSYPVSILSRHWIASGLTLLALVATRASPCSAGLQGLRPGITDSIGNRSVMSEPFLIGRIPSRFGTPYRRR